MTTSSRSYRPSRTEVMQAIARKRLRQSGQLKDKPTGNEQERWTARYAQDLPGFCQRALGMKPWRGVNGFPGQLEVLEAVQESVTRQLAGEEDVPYIFVVEAPHGVGKTYGIEAPTMAWFYRCFAPSVIQSTANSVQQVRDALWKDLRSHVQNARNLRRTVMPGLLPRDMRAEQAANHFAMGFTTSDAGGSGTERAQGQHNDFHLWVFDEAEGVPTFMYDAVKRQLTGNRVRLWLIIANPKTSSSDFQEMKLHPLARVFRMSLLGFPNVWNGSDEVPGGTKRSVFNEWIEDQRTFGCEVVPEHDEARHTFTVPWDVPRSGGGFHPAGTIFAPKRGFLYGALGIPPSGGGGDTFISAGRYDACIGRSVEREDEEEVRAALIQATLTGRPRRRLTKRVQLGIDCARFGDDAGTLYSLFERVLRFEDAVQGAQDADEITRTDRYVEAARKALRRAATQGATAASIRVDMAYGGGIVDALKKDEDLQTLFPDGYHVYEVPFGASPMDREQYADLVTEMYALADEVLSVTRIENAGLLLKRDLTERKYGYVTKGDRDVKKLEQKTKFKTRTKGQSPDDGDGAVLALAPERLFVLPGTKAYKPPTGSGVAIDLQDLNKSSSWRTRR